MTEEIRDQVECVDEFGNRYTVLVYQKLKKEPSGHNVPVGTKASLLDGRRVALIDGENSYRVIENGKVLWRI